jgi:4-amino-4-deoxy-L-arabinose transferase-like glycosyltransferase
VALLPIRPRRRAGGGEPEIEPGRRSVEAALLAFPILSFLIFLHGIYDHRDVRYFLGGIAVAALGWGYLADRLERSGRKAAPALAAAVRAATLAGVVLALALRPPPPGARPALWLAAGATLGLLAAARWDAVRRGSRALAAHPRRAAAAAALLALPVAAQVAARYPDRKLEHGPVPRYLEEHLTGEEGATVAYVGLNAPYLYYGSRLQNRVVIVPSTRDLEGRLYRWGGTTERPLRHRARYRHWLRNLELLEVTHVAVVRAGSTEPERGWMLGHPDRFRPVAEQGIEEIWRFEGSTAGDQSPSR